jgi:hypothetical protein
MRISTEVGAPSRTRPPWFETYIAGKPRCRHVSASCHVLIPFGTIGRVVRLRKAARELS